MSQNVQKTFLVDDKKSKNKEKLTAKKLRPIFWNFNFWWVVFIKKVFRKFSLFIIYMIDLCLILG